MNTPCWEADGWTGLARGDATELLGTSRVNDIAGKAARVTASERATSDFQNDLRDQTKAFA